MQKSMLSLLAGAIASLFLVQTIAHAAPDELSVDPTLVLKEQRLVVCADNLACWKRKTLFLDQGLEGALLKIDLLELRLQFAGGEIEQYRTIGFNQKEALEALKPVILANPHATPPVSQSPVLWFGVGFGLAALLSIGIFAIAKRIDIAPQQ
jgi:hypothetical protein